MAELIIHKRNQQTKRPLCWGGVYRDFAMKMADNIDKINCVDCLRMLTKDAVIFGNGRRARHEGR